MDVTGIYIFLKLYENFDKTHVKLFPNFTGHHLITYANHTITK